MDLTKVENRKSFIKECEISLINELKSNRINLSERAVANIYMWRVEIGVNYQSREDFDMDFASEITIYIDEEKPTITYGTSGSFNPLEKDASYWRTIHAAEIIKNWNDAIAIIKEWWAEVSKLNDIPVVK